MRTLTLIGIIALAFLLFGPASAAAEGFADLYGGGAFTEDDDGFAVPGFSTGPEAEFESSGVVGGRAGAWADGDFNFLGAAFDVSWFEPDGDDGTRPAKLDVIPMSVLLMGRLPLATSEEHPNGQIQPYLGVGPSLVVSKIEIPVAGSDFEDTEADVGVDLRTGLALVPVQPIGLFVEYRFTHFEPDYKDSSGVIATQGRASPELSTHFVQGGVSFRF